jgi:hypothetical protein
MPRDLERRSFVERHLPFADEFATEREREDWYALKDSIELLKIRKQQEELLKRYNELEERAEFLADIIEGKMCEEVEQLHRHSRRVARHYGME